ncbi:TPA: hypothetical protein ACTZ5N_000098 [Bacillus cereus]
MKELQLLGKRRELQSSIKFEFYNKVGDFLDIPKNVMDSIEKSSKAFVEARRHEKVVRDWLEKKEIDNDFILDNWIDSVEYGHGLGKEFIEFLKSL